MYNEYAYSSSSITVVHLQYLQNFSYIYSIGIPDSHNYSCKPTKSNVFSQKVVTRHNCVSSKQPIKSLN